MLQYDKGTATGTGQEGKGGKGGAWQEGSRD